MIRLAPALDLRTFDPVRLYRCRHARVAAANCAAPDNIHCCEVSFAPAPPASTGIASVLMPAGVEVGR
jgi:hypothetical protein